VLVWAVVTTGSIVRRPVLVPIRAAAAIGVAIAVTAAAELVRRESRPPSSPTVVGVSAASMVALSIALVLTVLPLVTAAIGRRRVVRWATTIQEAARAGTALTMLRDASGDPSLSFAGDGSIGVLGGQRVTTELHRGDRVVAVIEHRPESSDRLRTALTPPVVTALENELLLTTATRQLGDLRSARRRVVERGDDARRRLERDLHDGAQQRLLALGMQLSALSLHTDGEQRARLDAAVDHATLALANLRRLAHGVVPPLLDDAGLYEAITSLAEQTDLALRLDIESIAGRRFDPEVERAAYRLVTGSVKEALNTGASEAVVVATVVDARLIVTTRHRSDGCAPRLDDDDRVGAAGGMLRSVHVEGTTVREARFG
jgi:signal transduction histidine kinase